jgi:hypothetical protein
VLEQERVTLQDFQRLAGFSDSEDWTETIFVSEGSHMLCLRAWLDQQAVATHKRPPRCSTNSFQSDYSTQPEPIRSANVTTHSSKRTSVPPTAHYHMV